MRKYKNIICIKNAHKRFSGNGNMLIKLKTEPDKFYNITYDVEKLVAIKNGLCIVFCPGSTGAIIINEDNAMLLEDLKDMLEKLAPKNEIYNHSDNAHSHIRACLLGPGKTIPIKDGKLVLGEWQDIIFCECDTRPRDRTIIVNVVKG